LSQISFVRIAKGHAEEIKCKLGDGVTVALKEAFSNREEQTQSRNAHLAIELVNAAHRVQEEALFKDERAEDQRSVLAIPDFRLDEAAKLGDDALKRAIDEDIANLVGMEKAQEWFKETKSKIKYVEKRLATGAC
jgi:hypothetical protein